MTSSLSRFQIVEGNPPNLPHQCAVCGSINGTFIDFQLDLEFYGTVYFCVENCFTQLANELGYRSPAQHKTALIEVEILRAANNNLKDDVERYKNAVATLRSIDSSNSGIDSASLSDVREGESHDPGAVETKPGSNESSAKPGSSHFFNDDGIDDLLSNSS